MNPLFQRLLRTGPANSWFLIRLLAGWVFLSEGLQKFIFPEQLGVGRFAKIGLPSPEVLAHFVGTVEIVAGLMLLAGFLVRLASLALIIDMLVAIGTTKIPMLIHEGFWKAAHEARVDFSMLFACLFLLIEGGGAYSADRRMSDVPVKP